MPRVCDVHCPKQIWDACGAGHFSKTKQQCPYFVGGQQFYCANPDAV